MDPVADDDLELAHSLATIAAQVAMPFVATAVPHNAKADGTPVSRADLTVEATMIALLEEHRPYDGILAEESGEVATGARRWILDPIDGTSSFVTGGAEWGTHVALEVAGEIVLGIITRPLAGRRWWAAHGHGAYADTDPEPIARAQPLGVSTTTSLASARVGLYSASSSSLVPRALEGHIACITQHGSHIIDLVEGRLDAIVSDNCGDLWDHAPAVILTKEAGGRFTDPNGGTRADLRAGLYTNGPLHAELRAALAGAI